ncbi:hypothetical protein EW146_g774, partial [Bondarzewia mesenterica]
HPLPVQPPPACRFPPSPLASSPPIDHNIQLQGKSKAKHPHSKIAISHPYARLFAAKKDGTKRRKIWNHALEKSVFTPQEISTMGAPHRRTIYIASLEAHVDRLHAQLLAMGLYPIPFDKLDPYKGLNSKTAKVTPSSPLPVPRLDRVFESQSMVSGLQHDTSHIKTKLLELERANLGLRNMLKKNDSGSSSALESPSQTSQSPPDPQQPAADSVSRRSAAPSATADFESRVAGAAGRVTLHSSHQTRDNSVPNPRSLIMDTTDLETYQVQLSQVETALSADPDNAELASLCSELKELIELTQAALAQSEASTSTSKPGAEGTPSSSSSRKLAAAAAAAQASAAHWSAGDECLAKYSGDGGWYPARINSVGGSPEKRVYSIVFKGVQHDGSGRSPRPQALARPLRRRRPSSFSFASSASSSSSKRKVSEAEEQEREKKRKKNEKKLEVRAAKAKEQNQKQATWQKFTKKSVKKGVHIAGVEGTSIFKTPDNPMGRVGVTGQRQGNDGLCFEEQAQIRSSARASLRRTSHDECVVCITDVGGKVDTDRRETDIVTYATSFSPILCTVLPDNTSLQRD